MSNENGKPPGFSRLARRCVDQPISYLMVQAISNPNVISLAAGLVDPMSLPVAESRQLFQDLLADDSAARAALQYGTTEGLGALRQTLAERLAAMDGVDAAELGISADRIVLTSGSQQFLYILTELLIDPGDIVITAWPSYFVYTGVLQSAGAQVRCVEMDADGMIPASLDGVLAQLKAAGELERVKIVYVVSYHQNPTGLTLSAERRPEILEIVERYSTDHRIMLVEDAAYRELTFEGDPPPSIRSFDRTGRTVALLQTFSKPFAPGLKTGYGLLPPDLVAPVVTHKGSHDFGSANLCQHILAQALDKGVYDEHLVVLHRAYRRKRDVMLEALAEHLTDAVPGEISWTHPTGGLYVYLTLPDGLDTGREGALFARAIQEGVLYVPGEFCFGPDPERTAPVNAIRLTFGVADEAAIRAGIERLGRAVRAVAGRTPV